MRALITLWISEALVMHLVVASSRNPPSYGKNSFLHKRESPEPTWAKRQHWAGVWTLGCGSSLLGASYVALGKPAHLGLGFLSYKASAASIAIILLSLVFILAIIY